MTRKEPSNGWEDAATRFIACRSKIGVGVALDWSRTLPKGGAIVDIGAGSGAPISEALDAEGFELWAIDASPTMIAAYRRRFPHVETACEPAERSGFFGRSFEGAIAVGLMFLLAPADQHALIDRVARALKPGGRFLFSAPRQPCAWRDSLTGRVSKSLGEDAYGAALIRAGLRPSGNFVDEGENFYIDAVKDRAQPA